jgi:AcrR family transcriptional regulator
VLAAARTLFAERGYRGTSVRAIGATAGVTPAMVHHFFGSKQQVFLAAIRMPIDPAAVLAELVTHPRDEFPERFVRRFVGYWSDPATGPALQSLIRSAVAGEETGAAVRAFASTVLLPRASDALDVPAERMAAALSIMLGMAIARWIIGIEQLAALAEEQLVARYVPAVRAALGI